MRRWENNDHKSTSTLRRRRLVYHYNQAPNRRNVILSQLQSSRRNQNTKSCECDGTIDPQEQISSYCTAMRLQEATEEAICLVFSMTLQKIARNMYNQLPFGSIISFHKLQHLFTQQFKASRNTQKSLTSLFKIKLKPNEFLTSVQNQTLDTQDLNSRFEFRPNET